MCREADHFTVRNPAKMVAAEWPKTEQAFQSAGASCTGRRRAPATCGKPQGPIPSDRACFSMLTRGPQRAREHETTHIGSKSAAEPHERMAKESQLEREFYLMAARQERIDAFIHEGSPPADQPLEILCEDHVGTYVIPFLCQWTEGTWQNAKTRRRIEAAVIGWREPKRNQR